MRSTAWALFTVAGCFCAFAEKLPTKTYTTADGLGHNHINRIKTDSHGFLWICTDNGVSRFDGQRFFTLTMADGLPHPDVNDIVEDRHGVFWMATDGGVSRFKLRSPGTNERPAIETFRPADNAGEHFDAVEIDRAGRIWTGGKAGLYLVDTAGGSVTLRLRETVPKADVPRILAARNGGLWIATSKGASYRKPEGEFLSVPHPRAGQQPPYAQALLEDEQGRLWVGYRTGGGLCQYSTGVAGLIREEFCITDPKLKDIRAALETADGRFWLGTAAGLCELDRNNRSAECYGAGTGVSDDRVLKLGLDREGNLWLGTGATGLIRVSRPGFARFSNDEGFVQGFRPSFVESRQGRLLIANDSVAAVAELAGPGRRRAKLIPLWRVPYPALHPFRGGVHSALEDHRGRWVFLSWDAVLEFPSGTALEELVSVQARLTALPNRDWPGSLFQDRGGALWVSTRAAPPRDSGSGRLIVKAPGKEFQAVREVEGVLAKVERQQGLGARVSAFGDDGKGSVWLGLSTNHLVHPRRTILLLRYRDGALTEYSQADGVPGGNVNAMHVDRRGRLWLATQAGLARGDDPGAERPRFIRYGTKEGLSSDEIWSVTEDAAGRIYAGTAKGVDRLDVVSGHVRHFSVEDGLPPGSVLAAMKARDGTLWFATETALAHFEPETQTAPAAATFLASPADGLQLPHNRNYFEAQFTSPGFGGGSMRYQYRLSGQDWGSPVSESIVRYAGMGPGSYELQARAVTPSGLVSPQPVSLRFTVLPPFWRTWWFLSLAFAGVLALLYALHRYRVTQLLALERVRTRIASDLHDDIGSTLSQVSMLGELARRSLNGQHPAATDLIDRMSAASREAVAAMSDIVWSIHPSHDRASDLAQRMRSFASDLLSARDIDFDFRLSEGGLPAALEPEVRRDLLLVFKESVHNAARHAACTEVRAELNVDGRQAVLTVEDDGGGIAVNGQGSGGSGHGLFNMRARAEKAGGSLAVEPRAGASGTRVTCRLPLAPRRRGSETNMRQR